MKNLAAQIEFLNSFHDYNPVHILYKLGFEYENIVKAARALIKELAIHNQPWEEISKNELLQIWAGLLSSLKVDETAFEKIEKALDVPRKSFKENRELTLQALMHWQLALSQSESRFWSNLKHQQNPMELSIEDFLEETAATIGKTIEGLIKPYLQLWLQLSRINRKTSNASDSSIVKQLDLGVIIDELISHDHLANILTEDFHGLRLHTWRNIAYHHNTSIVNNKIVLEINSKNSKVFEIERDQLFLIAKQIHVIWKFFRLALNIFLIDNSIRDQIANEKADILVREESNVLDFYSAISSQGFKIEYIIESNDESILMGLTDLQEDLPTKQRAIHSSQLLFPLWQFSKKDQIVIEYKTKKGTPVLKSSVSSKIWVGRVINEQNLEDALRELINNVKFEVLSDVLFRTENPFNEVSSTITDNLSKRMFLSQDGEPINAETFIQKFTLSIFAIYLALTDEGAKRDNINVKLLNDAAMITSEISDKKFVFTVPGPVQDFELRTTIGDCLDKTISYWQENSLVNELIIEAKENNGYLTKRIMIRSTILEKV